MLAFQSIRHLRVVTLIVSGLAGITASIGFLATATPALAAEKTADLARYCRKHHGPTAFANVDRRDGGLMCSLRTHRGRGLLHRKIAAADVCAEQHRTRRFRRKGKGLVCTTGSGGGVRTAKTIDLKKHCRARYGPSAKLTRRRTDGRPMCTIRTNNGRGLRHHVIDLASLCGGGSPRADVDTLRCEGSTAGVGAGSGSGGKPGTGPGSWSRWAGGDPKNLNIAPANRTPPPTPRRKGGGKLTKADFRGCSVDPEIRKHMVAMPGVMTVPVRAVTFGAVSTPCPGLAGGRVVDLVEFCRKGWLPRAGVGFMDGRVLTCSGAPGTVSSRPYPGRLGRYRSNGWYHPTPLIFACGWAGGISRKKWKTVTIVYKYDKRRLECFYFKRARYMAIWKPGKSKIAPERVEFVSADRPRKVLAKLRPGLRFVIRLTFGRDPGGKTRPVTLRQVKGGGVVRYTARRVGRTNVFETGVIRLVWKVTP